MKTYWLDIDGKKIKVFAEKIAGKLWYHYKGETKSFEPISKYGDAESTKANAVPGSIVAPMPGKIIKIKCQNADSVAKGQVVVTMEAMKMEYSLESDISGEVVAVNFQEGDQVNLGQEIVKIEADNG